MKRTIITVGIALALIAVGALMMGAAYMTAGRDLTRLSTEEYACRVQDVEETFENISVRGVDCDVRLALSDDGQCRVESMDSKNIVTTVEAKRGTLTVTREDNRPWYARIGFGISIPSVYVTVYLPEGSYEALDVRTVSGDIQVPDVFSFDRAEVKTTSGNIVFPAATRDEAAVSSTSGDIFLYNDQGNLTVSTTSGQVSLEDMEAESLSVSAVSGDVVLERVRVKGAVALQTVSGEIRLRAVDGEALQINTTSGDVRGDLLTGKNFETHTVSGDVTTPPSDSAAGVCRVQTVSGDIWLEVGQ